ncbi:MAG: hypothetical protein C0434_06190 [Xanthomonadaceae bacterium]|nr:hypothetical protein [Xanthomonadaceae bacterium]
MAVKKSTRKPVKPSVSAPNVHRILNVVPSHNTENDWTFGDAEVAGVLGAGVAGGAAPPPSSVDLRADWWEIGDQGSTGSCVGWASTDGVMRYELVKANKITRTAQLSTRFTWMASKETDEFTNRPQTFIEAAGTSLKAALDICRKYGVVHESLLSFNLGEYMYLGNENAFYLAAAQLKAASYVNIGKNLQSWRSVLAQKKPILVALSVDDSWNRANDNGGEIDSFLPNTVSGGHAVCVVGYRSDGHFIVRNSWGTGWGDRGFAYVSANYINAAFWDECYTVNI